MNDSNDLSTNAKETSLLPIHLMPSINELDIINGVSYTYHSKIPNVLRGDPMTSCVLGIDEAGRGPVLGPMVYGLFYLPVISHKALLSEQYHFDDSKVLSSENRLVLFQELCDVGSELYKGCGWAVRIMSAKDISAGMLRATGSYNLNTQAMDATISLIHEVIKSGVNVAEIYIDTIGNPAIYQKKLEILFPTIAITVAKKADSLYPCVSAASVCAKVTRDLALEVIYQDYLGQISTSRSSGWGSGYPSDSRTMTWMKSGMDLYFGWGHECRFSWSTAKDLLETTGDTASLNWLASAEDQSSKLTKDYQPNLVTISNSNSDLSRWYGHETTSL